MNIGIIGTSFIVDHFCDAARKIPGVSIRSIYSRDPLSDRVKALCSTYQIDRAYGSLFDFYQDGAIDFVYVTSPNSLHYEHCLAALNAGKHVICEKPWTSTVREAESLVETARSKDLMIFEAITSIHLPNFQLIQEHLHEIGQPRLLELNYSQYSRKYDQFLAGKTPNVFNPSFSGGALVDINIYNVHVAVGLFGKPETVQYFPNRHLNGIDTSGVMVMQYPGFTACLIGSKDTQGDNSLSIQGEKGMIRVPGESNSLKEVVVRLRANQDSIVLNDQTEQNRFYYELKTFHRIYSSRDYEAMDHLAEHSLLVVGIIEKARLEAGIVFAADSN